MSEKQFEGKSAIVTGATRGIGKAIAAELAARGCNVAFNYSKSADEAEKLKAELDAIGVKTFAAQCDVADTAAAGEFVGQVKEAFGTVDFLINNAGLTRDQLILRMKEEDWDSVIDTNLKGAWNFSKHVLRPMLRNENGGSILNIAKPAERNHRKKLLAVIGVHLRCHVRLHKSEGECVHGDVLARNLFGERLC